MFLLQLKSVAHLPWRAFMYKVGLLHGKINSQDGPMDGLMDGYTERWKVGLADK